MEVVDFDYSVRVQLASHALCGQQTPSVTVKLVLKDEHGDERPVMVELSAERLQQVLKQCADIREELDRKQRP